MASMQDDTNKQGSGDCARASLNSLYVVTSRRLEQGIQYEGSILLNIMFHAPMGTFQLELIYCFTFILHRRPF